MGPQTEKTLANLAAMLSSAGSSLDRVLKVNIYMPEQADYAAMNEVYKRVGFGDIEQTVVELIIAIFR